jgi:hypothetical protein
MAFGAPALRYNLSVLGISGGAYVWHGAEENRQEGGKRRRSQRVPCHEMRPLLEWFAEDDGAFSGFGPVSLKAEKAAEHERDDGSNN